MVHDALSLAERFMRRRNFSRAIKLLEGRGEIYEGNFDYYILLANACLYAGDAGTAAQYYGLAREIKLMDTTLLLGQAAIFLRRGDTEKAIQYYLEVLDGDPQNKTARDALEFIRTKGDYNTICKWIDNGRIKKFYPPIKAVGIPWGGIIPIAACVLGALSVFFVMRGRGNVASGGRVDLSALVLSVDERRNSQVSDMSGGAYKYILSNAEINKSYADAQRYFQSYRDNAAQIEINRLLNSNAVPSIKQKARTLMSYLSVPTFDTIQDNPSYADVVRDIDLYMDCYVVWAGRISNASAEENAYRCDLLVGYETMQRVEGVVPLKFEADPDITGNLPVRVLGKVAVENGRLCLECRAAFQSVGDALENP